MTIEAEAAREEPMVRRGCSGDGGTYSEGNFWFSKENKMRGCHAQN